MQESIISGITPVDLDDHMVISCYEAVPPDALEGTLVAEIAGARLRHTRSETDPTAHRLGKIGVFGRVISDEALASRIAEHAADPHEYDVQRLKNLK